jgi:hypothetical protein
LKTKAEEQDYYRKRLGWTWPLVAFGLGGYMNLSTYLNDLATMSTIQWVFFWINAISLIVALTNYIYCRARIYQIKRAVKKGLS